MMMKSRMIVNCVNASRRDQERLVARKAALAFLLVVDRRSERLFGHDT